MAKAEEVRIGKPMGSLWGEVVVVVMVMMGYETRLLIVRPGASCRRRLWVSRIHGNGFNGSRCWVGMREASNEDGRWTGGKMGQEERDWKRGGMKMVRFSEMYHSLILPSVSSVWSVWSVLSCLSDCLSVWMRERSAWMRKKDTRNVYEGELGSSGTATTATQVTEPGY